MRELGARGLVLLRLARHDGDDDQVLRRHSDLFGVVALCDCAEHLLGRLAGGWDVEQVGEVGLDEVDPSRAAACQNREILVGLDAFDQFVPLLHDCEVCAEVGVEDLVESQGAETRDQLAGDRGSWLEAKLLADCDSDCRGCLDNHGLRLVVDRVPDLLHIADAGDRADGACVDALPAECAGGVRQRNH